MGDSQTGLENVALWHERDISHSGAERVILPDATITLDDMHHVANQVASGLVVHTDRLRSNLELTHGALFSQRALTALVDSGMSRDDAYRTVQAAAQEAFDTGTQFRELIANCSGAGPRRDLRLQRVPHPPARSVRTPGGAEEMILYLNQKDHGPHQLHPCGKAGHALKEAGYEYEIKTKKGYTLMPWTWDREERPGRRREAERPDRRADPRSR